MVHGVDLIWRCIFYEKILAGEPIDVFGFGKMRRDFTYIDDIVEGVFSLLDKKPSGLQIGLVKILILLTVALLGKFLILEITNQLN